MDEYSQKEFDRIIKLEIAALSESDKRFLRARQSYLSPKEKDIYQEILDASDEVQESSSVYMSTRMLKQKAATLGIDHKGKSREEIELAINTIEGPAGATQPE